MPSRALRAPSTPTPTVCRTNALPNREAHLTRCGRVRLSLMGAARRLCVRAVVLTVMMSALLSLALPSCQFPEYGIATGGGAGSAGTLEGGMPNLPAGAAGTAGDDPGGVGGDGNAGAPDAGAAGEPERPSCVAQSSCVPGPPADWVGP